MIWQEDDVLKKYKDPKTPFSLSHKGSPFVHFPAPAIH